MVASRYPSTTGLADETLLALDFSQTPNPAELYTHAVEISPEAKSSAAATKSPSELAMPVQSYRSVNGLICETEVEARHESLYFILKKSATPALMETVDALLRIVRYEPYHAQLIGELFVAEAETQDIRDNRAKLEGK